MLLVWEYDVDFDDYIILSVTVAVVLCMKTQIREGIQNEMCVERVCERISAASPTPQTHRGETICTATLRLFLLTTIITKKIP